MPYTVQATTFAGFDVLWKQTRSQLNWNCLFMLPFWLQTVHEHAGRCGEPLLLTVRDGDTCVGIAPLAVANETVFFLGNPEVCDYQDLIAAPGCERSVLQAVAGHLSERGLKRLDLGTLRPDAVALTALHQLAHDGLLELSLVDDDVTFETALPASWELYLQQLDGKQRHEVRRKLRRLESSARIVLHTAGEDDLRSCTDAFIALFRSNREDKAAFMTNGMEAYFRTLITESARHQMLGLHLLMVDDQTAASVLCFDYNGVRYLYNSGYDQRYQDLSVGVLSKLFSIQRGIEMGCRRYDFLKGAEIYKKRIGGSQVPLYRCRVTL
jgi:CelD/BcsL family acetyltransferase involved in cellulose biosynthesis